MKIRRIVTGRDGDGRSVFADVADAPRTHDFRHIPGMSVTQLWSTGPQPELPAEFGDPTLELESVVPDVGGTQFMIVAFPPDSVMFSPDFDPVAAGAENLEHSPGLAEKFEPDNPGMHTTDTVDYGICLRGEISLELDDGAITDLAAGDVVIQNGTRHAWRNKGSEPALMAFVLIGARRGD